MTDISQMSIQEITQQLERFARKERVRKEAQKRYFATEKGKAKNCEIANRYYHRKKEQQLELLRLEGLNKLTEEVLKV
jgi:hypothetical protein